MRKKLLTFSGLLLAGLVAVPAAARLMPDTYPKVVPLGRDVQLSGFDRIVTIEQLDAVAQSMKPEGGTENDLVIGLQRAVSGRFIHGYSKFSWRDNPYVRVLDLIQPTANHASPMRVNDILRFNDAACSQQGLVLQKLLKRHGIDYATVAWEGPQGHYAVAAKVDGVWRYYDSDLEPAQQGVPLRTILRDPATVLRIYTKSNEPRMGPILASYTSGKVGRVSIRDVDGNSAARGQAMHDLTFALMGGLKV